ncbi:MAG: radical SAM protein [Planctomycetota bacterium]
MLSPVRDYPALKRANSQLLREDVERRAIVYRGLPEVVTLNHSDICNLRCVMCPRNLAQGKHRLDQRVLEHVVNELFPTAHKVVLTTAGGDPLAVDFDFLLERALRFGVRVDAVTNGVLLTPDVYQRARGALDHLNVSLDSHVPEVYERIRLGARYERIVGNLSAIAEERRRQPDGVLLSLSAVVMRSNLPHLADFVRFARQFAPDGIVLQRLRHEVKPTPEEEPERSMSPAEIAGHLADAATAAREAGLNLFTTELGVPSVIAQHPRPKVPPTLEGHGLCWFLAQNFNVMYTGEVFPCCIPTDYCLGDVRYQDPAEIWNGTPMQNLRAAHLSRRGTVFCSGCLHAPHLPARGPKKVVAAVQWTRARSSLARSWVRRRVVRRHAAPIFATPAPELEPRDGGFLDAPAPADVTTFGEDIDVATVHPADGSLWIARAGRLWRHDRAEPDGAVEVTRLVDATPTRVACLHWVAPDALVFAVESGGGLQRLQAGVRTLALPLSEPRAFVRQSGVSLGPDGTVWVGEYGVFPGARCARVYRSRDAGRSFVEVQHLPARHVHLVQCLADGRVLITTGDLGAERRLYVGTGAAFRCLRPAWAGFVACARTAAGFHFGTELSSGNGLLRFRAGLESVPEFRALPAALDLQVRRLAVAGDGRLFALCAMDADLVARRKGRRAVLLGSDDDGATWSVVHRFAADWSDATEDFVLLPQPPTRLLTTGPGRACLIHVEVAAERRDGRTTEAVGHRPSLAADGARPHR